MAARSIPSVRRLAAPVSAPLAAALVAVATIACTDRERPPGDSAAAAAPAGGAPMQAGSMMVDSAMVMLHGFCLTQGAELAQGQTPRPRRVELIVGGDAARRPTRITVAADSTSAPELTADLTAGNDAHAMCVGPGATIFIGGTAMYLGTPTLRVVSSAPVTVLARTVHAETLAGPVEVRPGQRGVVLEWGAQRP